LIKFGYSKDKRPDLQQYRQMLGTLDPCGMPLVGATLAGNGTDEADYVPTWRQMKEIIGNPDFLYLADSKASTWHNRAKINEEGGMYMGGTRNEKKPSMGRKMVSSKIKCLSISSN
jgi:transposase